jgi:exopolysaccharide production protein ExoQ
MPPQIATIVFIFGIWGLFALDGLPKSGNSKALWIPTIWLLIAGSRNVGEWLHMSAPSDQGQRYLEGSPLDRAVLGALVALGIGVLFSRWHRVEPLLRANTAVLLFFAYCAVSSVWSDHPDVALKRWVRAIGDLVMVLLILTDPDWILALKRVLARVGFILLPLSVLLIRYYPSLGRGYSVSGQATFWTGVTTDKNGLGMICLIFGLGAVWRFFDIYKARKKTPLRKQLIALGVLVMTTLYLLWESNSMTSISCFVLAGALMLAMGRWPSARKPMTASILTMTAIAVSAFVLFGGGGSVLELLGRNPTLTGRTEVWHTILPFSQNAIVGSGYESFWLGDRLAKIARITGAGLQEAHNGYLEIYLNLGWTGLALLAIVALSGLRKIVLSVHQEPTIGSLRLAYFTLALIYNFTEAAFKMMNPVWIFFLFAITAPPRSAPVREADAMNARSEKRFPGPRPGKLSWSTPASAPKSIALSVLQRNPKTSGVGAQESLEKARW